jgi:hypothetical protein
VNRRSFITLLGGAAGWPLAARAQQAAPPHLRIGTASPGDRAIGIMQFFERRMRELGYVDGKNLTFDYLDLQGEPDRYGEAMKELVRRKVDIIVAFGPEAALKAALAASTTIPIVMIVIDFDPIARGYITSLARPTGNITGVLFDQIELAVKRLQLMVDAFPDKRAATVFWDQLSADQWRAFASSELRRPPQDGGKTPLTQRHRQWQEFKARIDLVYSDELYTGPTRNFHWLGDDLYGLPVDRSRIWDDLDLWAEAFGELDKPAERRVIRRPGSLTEFERLSLEASFRAHPIKDARAGGAA